MKTLSPISTHHRAYCGAQSIDVLLVVPATADLLAKFAQGIANDS